ncbi:hypothetical protein BH11BAC6_BH11BAC6_07000 [soil metagenome]
MKNHYILDTSVYLTYAAYDKIYRLVNAVIIYELSIFINQTLLDELEKNTARVLRLDSVTVEKIMKEILSFTTFVTTLPAYSNSPDPKDNFLFDLALQTQSEVIVTQEKALLNFEQSPVAIHDLKWFKETFPVPL